MGASQNVQVIYKIETIFVMDEKPFESQRSKKFNKNSTTATESKLEKSADK